VNPDAADLMRKFKNEVIRYQNKHKALGQFPARWAENAKRIAGVLHAEYYGDKAHERPLQIETVEYAIKAMRYLIHKQKELLHLEMKQAEDSQWTKFKAFLESNGKCVTMRDLVRKRFSEEWVRENVERWNAVHTCKISITDVINPSGQKSVYKAYTAGGMGAQFTRWVCATTL
jgi:hypothetical protein